ncbi:MAG: hypothetical protein F6K26_32180 [Moorea sp. SIO2I5]|nr:hypothetical protein [Moorena sp. SIO2I5]
MGILLWNGHLAVEWASCVELASCQFQCLDAVAHGEGLCAELVSAHSPVETTAVAHGGDPQDRAAFPRPRCIAISSGGQDARSTPIHSEIQ